MKDFNKEELESGRPEISAFTAIEFCLNTLYDDKTKTINDLVVEDLTFEELIGALLKARDELFYQTF